MSRENMLISVENCDQFPNRIVNSPRTLEACMREGIKPEELQYKPKEFFNDPTKPEQVQMDKYNFSESRRQYCMDKVVRTRLRIMEKLQNLTVMKPGTFLTPVTVLEKTLSYRDSADRIIEKHIKSFEEMHELYVKKQKQLSDKQNEFMMKCQSNFDNNLRKNLKNQLEALKKQEESDRKKDQEILKRLQEIELKHKILKEKTEEKVMLDKLQGAEKEREIQRCKEKFSQETMSSIQKKLEEKSKKKEKDEEYMKKVEAQENLYKFRVDHCIETYEQRQLRKLIKMKKHESEIEIKKKKVIEKISTEAEKKKKELQDKLKKTQEIAMERAEKIIEEKKAMIEKKKRKLHEHIKKTKNEQEQKRKDDIISRHVAIVKEAAEKYLQEKQAKLHEKLRKYQALMEEQEKQKQIKMEIKKEKDKLKFDEIKHNTEKQKNREEYNRELVLQKINEVNKKFEKYEQLQKILRTERFLTKIKNELKNYHMKEALEHMMNTKEFSYTKLENILTVFQPRIESNDLNLNDTKVLDSRIIQMLMDPFGEYKKKNSSANRSKFSNSSFEKKSSLVEKPEEKKI